MKKLACGVALLLSLSFALPARAAFGDRDCSFGSNGTETFPSLGPALGIADAPDGSTVARLGLLSTSSEFYRVAGASHTLLASTVNTELSDGAFTVLGDGSILFATGCGNTDCVGGVSGSTPPAVARMLPAGGLDPTFGTNGYATFPGFTAARTAPVLLPDGRIVVGGRVNGKAAVVRFNADGTVDAGFGSGGAATNSAHPDYNSIAALADGSIVAAPFFGQVYRHLPAGGLDPAFGSGGVASLGLVGVRMRVQPSGKILVAGTWMFVTGITSYTAVRIARLLPTGALDTSVAGGTGYREPTTASGYMSSSPYSTPFLPLGMTPDGKPLLIGQHGSTTGGLVRLGVDLEDDAAILLDFAPSAVAARADGGVLVGGRAGANGPWLVRALLSDSAPSTCIATTIAMTSSPNPSSYGQAVDLTATVTPAMSPPATGSVQFKRNGTDIGLPVGLVNGAATRSVSNLLDGANNLTAVFASTGPYLGSTSAVYVHNVTPRTPTTTTMSTAPNPSSSGQQVTYTATVVPQSGPGVPTGTVTIRGELNGSGTSTEATGLALVSGTATVTFPPPGEGAWSFTASYSGDATFAPGTSDPVPHLVASRLFVNDPVVNGANGATSLVFTVSQSNSRSTSPTVTVNYATADRSAHAGIEYTPVSGTLTFGPGQASKTVSVQVAQSSPGPNKDLFLVLSAPTNATLEKGSGIGTIVHAASGTLTLYVDDPSVSEGFSGITLLGFNVTLSRPVSTTVQVDYATANGAALAGTDYVAQSGTLTFPPGVSQRWIMVPINGNATVEGNRSFFLNLSNPSGAVLGKAQGTGTIVDDDPTPAASTVPMLRLYGTVTKEHLYTTDANEYAILGSGGWVQEGTAYTMFANAGTHGGQHAIPLYRLYHGGIRQHHWTTDPNEVMGLAALGSWSYEGIPGYLLASADAGTTPLYRLMYFSPPLHLWTTDANEKNVLSTQYGWTYEGVVGEVLP